MPEEIEEVETDIQQGDLIILERRGLTHCLMELDPDTQFPVVSATRSV